MMGRMGSWMVLGTLACLLAIAGCGSQDATEAYLGWTKIEAATHAGQSGEVDVCLAREWYGDGECDTFCPLFDIDCRDPETACMGDTDCGAEQFCDQRVCLSCCPDAPPGSACIAACCGVCRDSTSNYQPCFDDAACDAGEVCDLGECLSCCPDAPPGSDCIGACCGQCVEQPTKTCVSDTDCTAGAEWCIDGLCLPCDNSGLYCDLYCANGMVAPRNECQPCICLPDYVPCLDDAQCGPEGVCNTAVCLSCCPGAPPGTACIDVCCGECI